MYSGPVTKFSVNTVGEFYINSCDVHIENKCILQCNVMFEIEIVTMLMLSFILAETFITVIYLYLFSKKRGNKTKKNTGREKPKISSRFRN